MNDKSSCCSTGSCSRPDNTRTFKGFSPVTPNKPVAEKEASPIQTETCQESCCTPAIQKVDKAELTFSSAAAIKPFTLSSATVMKPLTPSACQDACCEADPVETAPVNPRADITGTRKLDYLVGGMDCPSCAETIVRRVRQLNGIAECNVNFSAGKMQVHASEAASQPEIEKAVMKLGFTLDAMTASGTEEYFIEGMDCGACATTIEKHLGKLPGVSQVSVNFSTGKMAISHTLSQDVIQSEVAKAGYKAQPTGAGINTKKRSGNGTLNVVVSGVALVTGFILSWLSFPDYLSTLCYALSIVAGGIRPARSAWYAILSKSLDMNVLMSSAAIGAAIIGEWLEGASVVFLFSLGAMLQARSIEKTRNSIRSLMALAPETATVRKDNQWVNVPVGDVRIGATMLIKPADRLPLDGRVIKGESGVNQAPITGESIPVDKAPGDDVYAGSINHNGVLEVEVTRASTETALSRIIHMVEEAQSRKSPTQSFVEKFSAIYTPIVFILALVVSIVPPLVGWGSFAEWFYRALELLVVACPCALVISTPVAIVSAIGNAARHGILVKGGVTLEKLGAIQGLAFDKTGTLTEGKPRVTQWQTFSGESSEHLLAIALAVESHSTHPLATAISDYARQQNAQAAEACEYQTLPGQGARAVVGGETWLAGNEKLFREIAIAPEIQGQIDLLKESGATVVLVGTKEGVYGLFAIADALRKTTVDALKALHADGLTHTLMLTGDNAGTARTIAAQAGVESWRADLLPEDKVAAIEAFQQKGLRIAMVGDGINDAPALAAADIGIAMGGAGTDSAIETADVVLMSDRLEQLPHAFALSKLTARIIRQNIVFSLLVKVVALTLIFPGWLTLWMAVLSDTGAAVLVILNSLRLLRFRR